MVSYNAIPWFYNNNNDYNNFLFNSSPFSHSFHLPFSVSPFFLSQSLLIVFFSSLIFFILLMSIIGRRYDFHKLKYFCLNGLFFLSSWIKRYGLIAICIIFSIFANHSLFESISSNWERTLLSCFYPFLQLVFTSEWYFLNTGECFYCKLTAFLCIYRDGIVFKFSNMVSRFQLCS